jgi:hypothetical protein
VSCGRQVGAHRAELSPRRHPRECMRVAEAQN